MTGPLYSSVMALHVLAAVIGFGALGATGAYAASLRRAPTRTGPARRYFRPGRNWAARVVLLVPVLGGVLLALGHGRDVGHLFPWIGLAIWVAATGVASAVQWPAEAEIQRLLGSEAAAAGDEPEAVTERLAQAAVRCERAAAVTSCLFAAALVVMIAQP